jgi:hypothetical protein
MEHYERNSGGLVWGESNAIICDFISTVTNGCLAENMVSLSIDIPHDYKTRCCMRMDYA